MYRSTNNAMQLRNLPEPGSYQPSSKEAVSKRGPRQQCLPQSQSISAAKAVIISCAINNGFAAVAQRTVFIESALSTSIFAVRVEQALHLSCPCALPVLACQC